jgi:spore coat protein H
MIKLCTPVVGLGLAALSALHGVRDAAARDSSPLWTTTNVACFEIQLSESAVAALVQSPRIYVSGTFKAGTNTLHDVGIRLKGHGTFQPLDKKPSFSIKFNEFSNQRYLGLSKILLNNSGDDPSYMREYIANRMFRHAGLPAPRIAHARVAVNGRDLGLYVVAEGVTKEFLRVHFSSDVGNLYEGEFRDVNKHLEQDNGRDKHQCDLKTLAEAAMIVDPRERWRNLHDVLDVERFIFFLALEQLVGQTDGYTVEANNYRIYHDPGSGRMILFPHGLDRAFSDGGFMFAPRQDRILTKAVLQTDEGRRSYQAAVEELFGRLFCLPDLTNCVNEGAIRLQAAATSAEEAQQIALNCSRLYTTLVQRTTSIAQALAAPELQPVQFGACGIAMLTNWAASVDADAQCRDSVAQGAPVLHIRCSGESVQGSFRTRVLLQPGRYVMAGEIRIANVKPVEFRHPPTHPFFRPMPEGSGAGLLSLDRSPGPLLTGSSDWQQYQYEFEVAFGPQEKELACELRGSTGEAWFKKESLRLIKR